MLQLEPMVHLPALNPALALELRRATVSDVPKIGAIIKKAAFTVTLEKIQALSL